MGCVTDTRPEPAPWDLQVLAVLRSRDGTETFVDLSDGSRLSVLDIAWGYDLGDEYAHVTTNCSPGAAGWALEFFYTSQVISLVDPRTLTPLLDHPSVSYEAEFVPLHVVEGRPAYTWEDAPTRAGNRCFFCDDAEVITVHMLDAEACKFRDHGKESTLPYFVTLCGRCEALARERDVDALTAVLERAREEDQARLIAEAFCRADLGGRYLAP